MSYSDRTKEQYKSVLQEIKDAGLFKDERYIHSPQAAEVDVEFPAGAPTKKVINMCANNYLGLSSHPEVVEAAHRGLEERGYGMSSVRFICGTQDIHRELENKLTKFLETEDTILFPSCMDANAGVFEAVLTDEDAVISDALNHASIIDGIRLCKAERHIYSHADMAELEEQLKQTQNKRFRLIASDGVFSMDGDTAKLDEMCELAEKYDAMIMID
ncbi:glycine C-acetyltransferase, partial [bacterium]